MAVTLIEDVMTPCPHSIGVDQPVSLAREMMTKHDIRHLPVQSGGRLLGVITHRDIQVVSFVDKDFKIAEIYTPEPFLVEKSTDLRTVAYQMADQKYGCALVVDKGKLVGIFTTVDACRALGDILT